MKKTWLIEGESDLPRVTNELINICKSHYFFAFYGEMGTGKTTLIKAIATNLGVQDSMSSPTYGLVNEYRISGAADKLWIYHMDLYRLKSLEEALDMGIEDYLSSDNAYVFVEWPELIEPLFPAQRVELHLERVNEQNRTLHVEIFG